MYYFDTYAFIEVLRGNPRYGRFKTTEIATTKLNLMEVYYWLLNNFGKQTADSFYDETVQYAIEVHDEVIKEAMVFRMGNKAKGLSYVDCIGYVLAKANGLRFLTGDIQFKGMDNVEFVQ
ncbi:MAG: PIN domain-containing protein [Candidatus Aenigmarchaeota archaeon]|nr:PIN domain-containing protein [Candidatus Aenigmarchaeota archaeon]